MYEFIIVIASIIIAEIGDKSHFITLLLGSKYKDHIKVFIGVMLAFLVTITTGVLLGNYASSVVEWEQLRFVMAFALITFGLYTYVSHEKGFVKVRKHSPIVSAFLLIIVAEFGDKSQFVTAFFAAQFNTLLLIIVLGVGLAIITALTLAAGKAIHHHVHERTVHIVGGTLFIVLGIMTFLGL